MDQHLSFDFFAQPKVISGLKALETIAMELESYGAHRPLVLSYAVEGNAQLALLKHALKESSITISAVCMIDHITTPGEFTKLLELLDSTESDAVIALGGGTIQSVAKMLNIMHSCNIDFNHIDRLPCPNIHLLPYIAVMDEHIDGREATCRLLIDEYRLSHPSLFPDVVIIDERVVGNGSIEQVAESAIITLAQLCESCREKTISPIVKGWINPAFRFLGDYQQQISSKKARLAYTNAAVYAQIAHSNTGYGPVTTLAELFEISQYCTSSEVLAALLPYYIKQLEKTQQAVFDTIYTEIISIQLKRGHQTAWKAGTQKDFPNTLVSLVHAYEENSSFSGKRPIIESMIRQTNRLLSQDDHSELLQLITSIVNQSEAPTAMGGDL